MALPRDRLCVLTSHAPCLTPRASVPPCIVPVPLPIHVPVPAPTRQWNYCTFEKNTLVEFAFDLYDLDGSGEIGACCCQPPCPRCRSECAQPPSDACRTWRWFACRTPRHARARAHTDLSEMQQIVREVYGDSFRTSVYAKKIMEKVYEVGKTHSEAGGPAQIDKPQFAVFTQKHPAMLFPAFRLQQELQKRVMGIPFWKKAARRRGQLFSEETNLKTFMSNITELAFKDMATFDEVEPAHGAYDESHGKADMRKVKSMPARKRSSAYALDLPGVVADDRPKKTKSASALQRPEDVAAKSARRAKAGRRTSNLQRSKSSHGGVAGQHVNAKGGTPAGSKALHEARRAAKRGR